MLRTSDPLSTTFAALADPTRRAILARLSSGEASVTELAFPFKMSMPAISKHLKVLEQAGLIARKREAQSRPCELAAQPLKEAAVGSATTACFGSNASTVSTHSYAKCKSRKRRRGRMSANPAAERELVLTRTFDAPSALVFDAWTDPKASGQTGGGPSASRRQ